MRFTANKLLSGLFLTAAVASSPSCADTDSAIFVRQVQQILSTDECVTTNDPNTFTLSEGFLDRTVRRRYDATVLVGNQLIPRGDNDRLLPETSRVHLYEAEIILFDFGGTELAAYTQPISGFADPTTSTIPGFGLANVPIIDPSVVDSLPNNQTIIARIKIFGRTLGGTEVETAYWDFPIDICDNCLQASCVPSECEDDCVQSCRPGQDEKLDCRAFATSCVKKC